MANRKYKVQRDPLGIILVLALLGLFTCFVIWVYTENSGKSWLQGAVEARGHKWGAVTVSSEGAGFVKGTNSWVTHVCVRYHPHVEGDCWYEIGASTLEESQIQALDEGDGPAAWRGGSFDQYYTCGLTPLPDGGSEKTCTNGIVAFHPGYAKP